MLISSDDDETSLHEVQKHNTSDSTLTSSSTSKTDKEMATGMEDPITTVIKPVQDP